jgi:hypothetical protein
MKSMFKTMIVLSVTTALGNAIAAPTASETATTRRSPAPNTGLKKKLKKKTQAKAKTGTSNGTATTAPVADTATSSASSALSAGSASSAAISAPTAAATSTTVAPESPAAAPRSKFIVAINQYYYGGSVNNPTGNTQPNTVTGDDAGAIEIDTHIALGYRINKNLSVSVNPQFQSLPSVEQQDGTKTDSVFLKPIAPYVKLGVGSFVSAGKFNWGGDFRLYPSITDDLKGAQNENGEYPRRFNQIRTGQNFTYSLSDKVSLGMFNVLRFYQREQKFQAGRDIMKVETFLQVGYQASDSLNFSLGYDMMARKQYGQSLFGFYNNPSEIEPATYLEPAVEWTINKYLTVNPYVDISTGDKINLDTSRVGLNVLMPIL